MSDRPKRTEALAWADEHERGSGPLADMVRAMLESVGENPQRDGLLHTPERFERAFRYLTGGYQQDPEKILNGAVFDVCYDEMVVVKDIEMYSLCEHHLLPFSANATWPIFPIRKWSACRRFRAW